MIFTNKVKKILRILFIVISSIITIGLILTAYSGNLSPLHYPRLAVLGMSFPIFLILQIIVAIGWLAFSKWKLSIIFFVPVILCIKSVYIYCPLNVFGNSVDESEKKTEIKLMTYNVFHFYDQHFRHAKNNISVENMLSVSADIVCLQESSYKTNDPTITKEQHDIVKKMYPYSNFKCYDIGILSKYPIISSEVLSKGSYSAAKYVLEIKGETVTIFNVHLQSIGLDADDKRLYRDITTPGNKGESRDDVIGDVKVHLYRKLKDAMIKRSVQADFLRSELDKVKGRVILCGDFNDTPNSYAYRTIKGDMEDAYVDCGFGPCITYNANGFYFRIDHVFYDGKIEAVDVKRPKFDASDHYPLIVDFVIKK